MLGTRACLGLALVFLITGVREGSAAEPELDRREDRVALATLSQSFLAAFAKADAAALADQFTSDAWIFSDDGSVIRGKDAIRARFDDLFATAPGAELKLDGVTVYFPSDNVAIEEGDAVLTAEDTPPSDSRYTVVYVKQDGKWLHGSIHERSAGFKPPHSRLSDLGFLVGDWVSESDDEVVKASYTWDENKVFLLNRFSVIRGGDLVLAGTERIGWDALAECFRSWVFDTEGGFSEGTWARAGTGQWIIKLAGVRADGSTASATRSLALIGPDRIEVTVTDRTLDNVANPEVIEFTIVRRPPEPKG